jgi:hypothetical protein
MDDPFDSCDCAVNKSDSLYTRVQRVKGLDVFWKNPPIFLKYFFDWGGWSGLRSRGIFFTAEGAEVAEREANGKCAADGMKMF